MDQMNSNQEITAQVNVSADHISIEIPNKPMYVVVNKKNIWNTAWNHLSTLTVEVYKPGYHIPDNKLSAACIICMQRYALKILNIVAIVFTLGTIILAIFSSFEVGFLVFAIVLWVIIVIFHIFKKRKEDRLYLEIFSEKDAANRFALANTSYTKVSGKTTYIDIVTGKTTDVHTLSYGKVVKAKILE